MKNIVDTSKHDRKSKNNLTVACVFNLQKNPRGEDYNINWVDRLNRACKRNIDMEFEFVCLSNVPTPYKTIPLISSSNGYWNKIELFRKDLFFGPVLYLDLDVLVCKNITNQILSLPTNKLLMTKEPYRDIVNSSIMYWSGDYSSLFKQYLENKKSIIKKYATPGLRFGDQSYISEHIDFDFVESYTQENFIAWRHHKVQTAIDDPSLLVFTSKQKPSNNLEMDLVKKHWIN